MVQMKMINRRSMLSCSAALAAGAIASRVAAAQGGMKRKFTLDLRCGSIGVSAGQREAIRLASEHGFESVNADPNELGRMSSSERKELVSELKERGLRWGAASLPLDIRGDESSFRAGAQNLPKLAKAMQEAGVTRVGTWVSPSHKELTYTANFRRHTKRFQECATILKDHGQRLGLEYIGPKTLWASQRHSFIHTMAECKELIAAIGVGNVGFVLDSWHWYTAHESVDELRSITNEDIVACDLNDAPKGIEIDEQIDSRRELPTATGVIDLKSFLSELVSLGYDGPVRAEPFNQALNAMDNEQAVAATAKAMKRAFELVDG